MCLFFEVDLRNMVFLNSVIEKIKELWVALYKFFDAPLFPIGNSSISLGDIVFFLISIILLIYLSGKVKKFLSNRILKRYTHDKGTVEATATIFRYIIIVLGLIIIFQTAGIDLSTLGIIAGALGVGIGFGLQNVTNNFISGIIILFERPIRVGDRIEVGNINGNVVNISARATTVLTNDNIAIIVPNSEFISSRVINWSHNDRNVRFWIPIGVSYHEDPQIVKKLLLEVADENDGILKTPAPEVIFEEFGDSSLNFSLAVFTSEFTDRPKMLKSNLNFAISEKFKKHKIEIPYPQRDLHLKSGFEILNKDAGKKDLKPLK